MQFGHNRIYVPATLKLYKAAIGLTTRFLHEGGDGQHGPSVFGAQPDAAARQ